MEKSKELIYGLNDRPPIRETIFCCFAALVGNLRSHYHTTTHHQFSIEIRLGYHRFPRVNVSLRVWIGYLYSVP